MVSEPPNLTESEMREIWDSFFEWLLDRPGRVREWAQILGSLAFVLSLMAVWAHFSVTVGRIIPTMAKVPMEVTLASMYLGLPTWFVPESWWSYCLIAVLWAAAFWLRQVDKKLRLLSY